jgi:hypothetical protein
MTESMTDANAFNISLLTKYGAQTYVMGLKRAGVTFEFKITEVKDKYSPTGAYYVVEPA